MKLKPNVSGRRSILTLDIVPQDVKDIATRSLGNHALDALFRDQRLPMNLIWKIVDGVSVGFAIYHFETIHNGSFLYRVGIIDMLCVDAPYQHKSYGAMITFYVLKAMSTVEVNRIEIMMHYPAQDRYDLYPNKPSSGSERFLFDLGFRKVAYFPKYWSKQSERYQYTCAICANSPCTCTGTLMAMNDR